MLKVWYIWIMNTEIKRLTVEINTQLHNEAKSRAYAEGSNLKEKIIELLKAWLHKV